MARPGGDRIKELSNTTGTGSFVLAGAVSGEGVRAFSAAEDGQVIRYGAKHVTADEGESGYGVYTHATRTLTRLYRYYPTLGGSAVSFSAGGVHIVCSAISGDFLANLDTVDPTANDDISTGFLQDHRWINTSTPSVWTCVDHTEGAAVWLRIDGGVASLDQYDIAGRSAAGTGGFVGLAAGDLTEEGAPEAGDFLLGWSSGSVLRKFDVGDLPAGGDVAPTLVTSNAATFALADSARLHRNVDVTSHQANVVFEVPQAASANSRWLIMPQHDGCTVTINGGVGTLTPSPARLVNGGLVVVRVASNPGSAPVVQVRGSVITPMTAVTTKTYDLDDDGQDFGASGTQTFSMAAATIPNGYYVNIWNTTAGNITIDGVDADHTLPAHGVVTVKKRSDGALVCNGSGGNTVLDAA